MAKAKSKTNVMTDRRTWLDLPLNAGRTDLGVVDGNVPKKVQFHQLPKLQVFTINVASTRAFRDVFTVRSKVFGKDVTVIKTGYSSGLILAVDGNNILFGKKVFFTEADVVTPMATAINYDFIAAPVADPTPAEDSVVKTYVDSTQSLLDVAPTADVTTQQIGIAEPATNETSNS